MNLGAPKPEYELRDQQAMRDEIQREDKRNLKQGLRIKGCPIYLASPDGSFFLLSVADDGTLSADPA